MDVDDSNNSDDASNSEVVGTQSQSRTLGRSGRKAIAKTVEKQPQEMKKAGKKEAKVTIDFTQK